MGQHFLFHRELVAATAVHHAVHARLTSDAQADLVLVGPQWLRVYRVEPFRDAETQATPATPLAAGHVLHMVAAFQLAGVAESVRVLRFDRHLLRKKRRFFGGQDVLLLSFPRFKWVLVGYDRRARALATLAMFSFGEEAMGPGATLKAEKNGREQLLGLATQSVVRVDPQTRCGAMLVYLDQLVVVPFRSESMELSFFEEDEDEDDDEEEEEGDGSDKRRASSRNGKDAGDDADEDEEDDDEEKRLEELVKESKQRGSAATSDAISNKLASLLDKSVKVGTKRKRNHMSGLMPNEITGREFLLRLRELDIAGKIVDLAFLDGYLEPTLMILHEENDKISTPGRLATGYDTYCLTVVSINLNTRLHPKIWSIRNLPSDCFRLIPCRAPLGGAVVLSANAILYFNQTQFYGMATNVFATKTVNQSVYPLEEALYETPELQVERLNVVLYDCQYEYLGQKEVLLSLPSGELFALALPYEDSSSRVAYGFGSAGGSSSGRVGLSLRKLRSGVSSNCMCVDEERKTLFVGSRSGDSVLFAFDEIEPPASTEDAPVKSEADEDQAKIKEEQTDAPVTGDDKDPAVKEEAEDMDDDEDDLFLYGSAPAASTTDGAAASVPASDDASAKNGVKDEPMEVAVVPTRKSPELSSSSYKLNLIDRLASIGQITSLELGVETNADSKEKREQLVASGGFLQDGAISVLHHGLRPIVGTEAELNGCRAMWTVSSSLEDARKSSDGRTYNSYLILSIGQRTMVLRTGEGMDPLEEDSGFYTTGPTLAAANLFGKQRIVQIFKQGARVMMEVPCEEEEKKEEKIIKTEPEAVGQDGEAEGDDEDDEDDDDGPKVKLVCTQEITLEGDVESGGMNVDTSRVGIVSVDVIDPFILILLTDGTVRLLMGDEDMELTVIDPDMNYYDGSDINSIENGSSSNGTPRKGISAACLFYDWAGMFRDNAWGEDEREERNESSATRNGDTKRESETKENGDGDGDDDMDDLYSTKPSPRVKTHHAPPPPTSPFRASGSSQAPGSAAATNPDGSVSVPLLGRDKASMMCGLCFEDGSLHVFSLPDFKKKGVFPYLTFAPQRLVNTMEHYQANRKKTVRFAAPVLGLNASSASANEGRIKKSHTINSPVADIAIHRVGPAEGQHNSQYLARMVLLVFLANGDLLMYAATPKMGNPRSSGLIIAAPSVVSFQFARVGTDLITRPYLPPRTKVGTAHNETGNNPEANTSAVLAKLRAGFRYSMLTRFDNINNMSGAFFRGAHPMWILSERGYPTFVPMCVPPAPPPPAPRSNAPATPRVSVPVLSFTPFHHWNCPNGFIYFHSRGALRVCELPSSRTSTILPLSRGFVLHKAELGVTVHQLLFLGDRGPGGVAEALETPTYALVCSRRLPSAEAEKATEHETTDEDEIVEENGDDDGKSNVMAPTAEMFPDVAIEDLPLAEEDVYELRLVQTNEFGEWDARRGVFRVLFERYEVVLSVQLMYLYDSSLMREDISSRSGEWARKKRPYLVVGTGFVGPHGEDESGRGRLLLYELDYAQYVNDDGSGATSSKLPKLRLVFIKEHRQGAISSVAQLGPYVLAAVGSKLIVYEFKSEQLIGCAFYDAQTFIVSISVVRDFVTYADVFKSAHFLRWREMQRQLVLLAKDYEPLAVTATEYSLFERKLALLVSDMEENLHVMQFAPHDVESRGGQRLLRTADFHLGVQVAAMLRKRIDAAHSASNCYVNLLGSSEGSLAALVPVPERVFRRLFTLQNVMINTLPQNCALNPRDFRALKTNSQRRAGRPDAWTKHKWKKSFLDALVLFRFLHLDYVAQKELARCIGTTPEVVLHNLLEVQRATATFL